MPWSPQASSEKIGTEFVFKLCLGVFDPPSNLDYPDEVFLRACLGEIGEE